MRAQHIPVMCDRIVDLFAPCIAAASSSHSPHRPLLIDGTLGLGGHTEALLSAYPQLCIIGVDRDVHALAKATERLAPYADRLLTLHTTYDAVVDALEEEDHPFAQQALATGVTGALYDLGVSSMQLDEVDRGFSYSQDSPLDMRMDDTCGTTAADILATSSAADIARILRTYGDEKFARPIANAIVKERDNQPFTSSQQLVELLYRVIPAGARRTGGHPAKRTFQALRVAVNDEIAILERALPTITSLLAPGGRAVFMSYQSHEDIKVKRHFRSLVQSSTPLDLPVELPGSTPEFQLVGRKAEKATPEEIDQNPRAASVRVRTIERTTGVE